MLQGFYEGRIAQAIVDVITELGGIMSLDDLRNHTTTSDIPISVNYRGVHI